MKKKLASIMVVFLIGILIFSGCGFEALKGGPELSDPVTSNGQMAVQKGNFLYFANGYTNIDNITEGNKFGSEVYSSIYRIELDANGDIKKDEEGENVAAELLAPKVVGTQNCSFYIFGNSIYYASPNIDKSKDGSIDYKKTDFFVSNLNGTNVKSIYKTTVSSTSIKFAFYEIEQVVYLVVYDSTNLITVNCSTKSVSQIATGVSSVVLPQITEGSVDEVYAFYTRTAVEEDEIERGNILATAKIGDNTEKVVAKNSTFTVNDFKDKTLIYTSKELNSENAYYFSAKFDSQSKVLVDTANASQLTYQAFSSTIVLNFENGNYRGMIVKNESGYLTHIKVTTTLPEYEILNSEVQLTPIAVYGDEVYAYNSDNELYSVNYKTKLTKKLTSKDNDVLSFTMTNNIDFDGRNVYVYKLYEGDAESGYYLVRINTTISEPTVELLGNVLSEHIPTEEE